MITAELSIFGQRQLRPGSIVRKKALQCNIQLESVEFPCGFQVQGIQDGERMLEFRKDDFRSFLHHRGFFHCLGQVSSYFLCRLLVQAGNRDSFLACQRGEQHKAQHGKMKKAESRTQEDQDPNDTNQTCWWIFWFSIASASSRKVALLQID